jgi:hypothetical protein
MRTLLLLIALAVSLNSWAQAPQSFKYQAVARDNGGSVIANQNIGFRISITENSPTGSVAYIETHNVASNDYGLVNLDIGAGNVQAGTFSGINWGTATHFIKVEMDVSGGTNYVLMGSSQLLSVPYALHAESANTVVNDQVNDADADPTNEIETWSTLGGIPADISDGDDVNDADADPTNELQNLSLSGNDLTISAGNTVTLPSGGANTLDQAYDQGGAGAGRSITIDAGPLQLNPVGANAIGLRADLTNTGTGLLVNANSAANSFSAIQASTNSTNAAASAIIGNTNGAAWGVAGQVGATATAEAGLYGSNLRTNGGHGVLGIGVNGVVGQTNYSQGNAGYFENFDAIAPLGNGIGGAGKGYYGIVGEDRYLGAQAGAYGVLANGNMGATGTKTFVIDHPQDPENKVLRHFSMESDEVLNVYRGTASFDANGEAVVNLPDYFEAINRNPTYQLTPIGGAAQLYIKEKIKDNQFVIAGGEEGMEVSWVVHAERNDPYLQQYPEQRAVELEKRAGQKGKYFMPQLYQQGEEKAIFQKMKEKLTQEKLKLAE